MNAAQGETIDQLQSELDQLEWGMDEISDDLLFAGNNADGHVLGSILEDGTVVYYV